MRRRVIKTIVVEGKVAAKSLVLVVKRIGQYAHRQPHGAQDRPASQKRREGEIKPRIVCNDYGVATYRRDPRSQRFE